jgi:TRAP-type mannitol/chloroaromatic compound transport system permease small subunit
LDWRVTPLDSAFVLVRYIDRFTEWTGRILAWLCFPLILALVYEVTARYLFHAPTDWAYDVTYMLYGTIFMLGAAFTLLKKAHIRTDLFYSNWSPRTQGMADTIMYVLFYFPGILFFLIAGWDYAAHSWATQEHTSLSPWRPVIYPFKTVIPVTAFLLLLQGVSELIKSIHAWRRGEWA